MTVVEWLTMPIVLVPVIVTATGSAALIVYVAVATALFAIPLATAIASIVVVELTLIGPVYFVEEVVGVVPFVV